MDFIESDRGGGRPESGWKKVGEDHGDKQRATNVIRTTSRGMSVAAVVIGGARPVPVCETDLTFGRRRSFG
jgi:hypothetical protein